jgi:hypothetical protein
VFSHNGDGDDHGVRRAGGMVVAIAVNFVTFYYIVVVELN